MEDLYRGIDLVRDMEAAMYEEDLVLITDDDGRAHRAQNGGVVKLEANLLELGGTPNVCKGVFYMLPILVGTKLCLRLAPYQYTFHNL
jgi:hypothetical protein